MAFAQVPTQSSEPADDVLLNVEDAGAVEIGASLIPPSSPLYFLKAIRERIEVIFATTREVKTQRQIEFAQRRLRELNSLVKSGNHELVEVTMERYRQHLSEAQRQFGQNQDLQSKVAEAVSRHLDVLVRVYDTVGNPRAKTAIRAAIERAEEQNRATLQTLETVAQQQLIGKIALRQAHACRFLIRESTASGLTSTEKEVLKDKVESCKKGAREILRDELQDLKQKRMQSTPSSTTR